MGTFDNLFTININHGVENFGLNISAGIRVYEYRIKGDPVYHNGLLSTKEIKVGYAINPENGYYLPRYRIKPELLSEIQKKSCVDGNNEEAAIELLYGAKYLKSNKRRYFVKLDDNIVPDEAYVMIIGNVGLFNVRDCIVMRQGIISDNEKNHIKDIMLVRLKTFSNRPKLFVKLAEDESIAVRYKLTYDKENISFVEKIL